MLIDRNHGFLQVVQHAVQLLVAAGFETCHAREFKRIVKALADAVERVGEQSAQTGLLREFHHQTRSDDHLEAFAAQRVEALARIVGRAVGVLADLDVEQLFHRIEFGNRVAVHHHAHARRDAARADQRLEQVEAAELNGGDRRLQARAQDARVRACAHERIDLAAFDAVLRDGECLVKAAVHHFDLRAVGVFRDHRHRELADLAVAHETQARQARCGEARVCGEGWHGACLV